MEKFDLLKGIKEKFNKYQTYYELLGVSPNNLNDDIVKNAYDNKCMQLCNILKDCSGEEIEEIRELAQTALDDAYYALKSENSREHYTELLDSIKQKSNERQKSVKSDDYELELL